MMAPKTKRERLKERQSSRISPYVDVGSSLRRPQVFTLASLDVDQKLQFRESTNAKVIEEYAENMVAINHRDFVVDSRDEEWEPIVVYHDKKADKYWLVEGFHRVAAALKAGFDYFQARIKKGTFRDATEHALRSNASHGLRRTNADKRRAVAFVLQDSDWCLDSDSVNGRRCGVDGKTVASVRRELVEKGLIPNVQKRRASDGKIVPAKIDTSWRPKGGKNAKTSNQSVEFSEIPSKETSLGSDRSEPEALIRPISHETGVKIRGADLPSRSEILNRPLSPLDELRKDSKKSATSPSDATERVKGEPFDITAGVVVYGLDISTTDRWSDASRLYLDRPEVHTAIVALTGEPGEVSAVGMRFRTSTHKDYGICLVGGDLVVVLSTRNQVVPKIAPSLNDLLDFLSTK